MQLLKLQPDNALGLSFALTDALGNVAFGVDLSGNVVGVPMLPLATVVSGTTYTRTTPFTMAFVFRKKSNPITPGAVDIGGIGLGITLILNTTCPVVFNIHNTTNTADGFAVTGSTSLVNDRSYVVIASTDNSGQASGMKLYINGVADSVTTTLDTPVTDLTGSGRQKMQIGALQPPYDYCVHFEQCLLNRTITQAEMQALSTYMNQRWNLF